MANNLFVFPCPCCNKQIEVDTRSGKARAVRPQEGKSGTDLLDLGAQQARDQKRLADLFSSAKESEQKRVDRLEEELRRAKDAAKQDKDERPRNPFDLE